MIHDRIDEAESYRTLIPEFARLTELVAQISTTAALGRTTIDGDRVFALLQNYPPAPSDLKRFESHRDYIDVHCMISGCETIHFAPVSRLQPSGAHNAEKDFVLYADPDSFGSIDLQPGDFAVFFPQDGHKTGCLGRDPEKVKKIVFKIRIRP